MFKKVLKSTMLFRVFLILSLLLPEIVSADVIWSADHDTGDLAQWKVMGPYGSRGGSYDSGDCIRPPGGVSTEQAHSGELSMKMSIASFGSGCRQFRHAESTSGNSFFYSAWLYFPKHYTVSDWTNIIQFKSESETRNDAVWVLELANRDNGQMYLMLRWKGIMDGPKEGEGKGLKHYHQTLKDVPTGRWFHIELFLKQSSEYKGQITVWQDGVQIYDMDDVKTKYPNGDNRWSINSYGAGINPMPLTLFVDDAIVSTSRIGPDGPGDGDKTPSRPINLKVDSR